MNRLNATLAGMVLAGAAVFAACESTPSAPDVAAAPPPVSGQEVALATSGPSYNRGDGALGVVYVKSQGLYYDTFVAVERLPPRGRFQLLEDGMTEYGPGDPGYLGGRWKEPDGNGGDRYFLCPLLPPGREAP